MWMWKTFVAPLGALVAILLLIVVARNVLNHHDQATARPRGTTANTTSKAPAPAAPPVDVSTRPEGTEKSVVDVPHNPSKVPLWTVEARLLEKTNAARQRHGLAPLVLDPGLQTTCRQHCTWMAYNHSMTHGHYNVGENIAMGQTSSSDVLNTWMNSSGHRANILGNYTKLGVASYITSGGTKFWCQQFRR